MPDRRTPFTIADEKQTLVDFLDYLRESMILKIQGISEEAARTPGVPSGTNLLWLVKHLAAVEMWWFHFGFAGRDVEVPDDDDTSADSIDGVIALYRKAISESNEIIAACADLDQRSARPLRAPEPMSMRWILVHLVEETARHAGHADILREQIDGAVGR